MHNLLNNTVSLQGVGDARATLLFPDTEACEVNPLRKTPKKWKPLRLKRELKQTTLRSCGGSSLFLESASSAGFFAPEAVEILKFKKGYPEMLMLLDQHLRYGSELLRHILTAARDEKLISRREDLLWAPAGRRPPQAGASEDSSGPTSEREQAAVPAGLGALAAALESLRVSL